MPSIDRTFLELLQDDYAKYPCFIETGTYNGETVFAFEPCFESLHTIEISEKYYNRTKSRYSGSKINFILGDSSDVLEQLLPTITTNCVFFLDGHWSAGDTGRGRKDVPLEEEVRHICNLFEHEAILIIDDFRLFGCSNDIVDWRNVNKDTLVSILQHRISKVYHLASSLTKDDRLIIHINAKHD